jgi:hypothetical protein
MYWEEYHGVDWTREIRGPKPKPYQVPKRYRKYNKKRRAARAERLQRYREYNEKRRREYGSGAQGTK